jgi:hypothetical protein
MAAANSGTIFLGTLGGLVGATALFYGITVSQPFGAYTPPDQNSQWQMKSEDRMVEGRWVQISHQLHASTVADAASTITIRE